MFISEILPLGLEEYQNSWGWGGRGEGERGGWRGCSGRGTGKGEKMGVGAENGEGYEK